MDLWLGLESYLQDNAADNGRRLVVFTGPIFGDTDPAFGESAANLHLASGHSFLALAR